jgi:hypothetical protein
MKQHWAQGVGAVSGICVADKLRQLTGTGEHFASRVQPTCMNMQLQLLLASTEQGLYTRQRTSNRKKPRLPNVYMLSCVSVIAQRALVGMGWLTWPWWGTCAGGVQPRAGALLHVGADPLRGLRRHTRPHRWASGPP